MVEKWGNFFKRKQTHETCLSRGGLGESAASTTEWTSVELEIVYARVHLLNEGGLYKTD